jgi:hypothetical protein
MPSPPRSLGWRTGTPDEQITTHFHTINPAFSFFQSPPLLCRMRMLNGSIKGTADSAYQTRRWFHSLYPVLLETAARFQIHKGDTLLDTRRRTAFETFSF